MAMNKALPSFNRIYFATVSDSFRKIIARHKRGYRDQNPKQAIPHDTLQQFRVDTSELQNENGFSAEDLQAARRYRFLHPEFLPTTITEHRDIVRETLEREDMMKRRSRLDIPEFYVGSIMAVTLSDPYADGKQSRFVGICIQRNGTGLRHNFTLRNVIDGQGIEIMYELYNPTIKKIEVLKLEKRLDEELLYLRDAPAQYSTISFDLEATPHPKGASIPINPIKVPLNPKPWKERWERFDLKGVDGLEKFLSQRQVERSSNRAVTRPWEKYDLMMKYRKNVPEEDVDKAYVHFTKEQIKLENKKAEELNEQLKK